MPAYDYQCRSCGVITEVVHSMLDDGPTECERCGGTLRRVIHPSGIIFRGGGFYKTDSRSSSSASVGGSKSGESGDAGASATSSTDKGSSDKGSSGTSSTDKGSSDKGPAQKASDGGAAKGGGGSD